MMSFRLVIGLVFGLIFGLMSSLALAHESSLHPVGFWAGFWHPISGLDHVLVMLAVGSWAAFMQSKKLQEAYFMLPVFFLVSLLMGAILALNQWVLPTLELIITLSVLAIGLILVSRAVLPFSAACVLIAGFALWHGNAHGLEVVSDGHVFSYIIGFICCTSLLHTTGYALGKNPLLQKYWQQLLGFLSCIVGAGLMMVNGFI